MYFGKAIALEYLMLSCYQNSYTSHACMYCPKDPCNTQHVIKKQFTTKTNIFSENETSSFKQKS